VRIELPNRDALETVEIPRRNLIAVLRPVDPKPIHDVERETAEGCRAAREACRSARRVLILVNDYTRPTPNAPILATLEPALEDKDVRVLICAGTHRAPTGEEMERVLGRDFLAWHRGSVRAHDAQDRARMFFAGKTRFGNEVRFNRDLLWPDLIIAVNSVEPHYFAGYTGGRKSFLPGVAAYETICHNHEMVTHDRSRPFGLEGNPVHEDMEEAAKMLLRPVFSIQLVLGHDHRPCSVRFGGLEKSFAQAAQDCRVVYALPIEEKADIILSVLLPPYHVNFYQSQRAVEFCRAALARPAVHITVSACPDGVGNDGFIEVFRRCARPEDVLAMPSRPLSANAGSAPRLGWHKSARLARILEHAELYTVVGVEDEVVRAAFMRPFRSIQAALDAALERIGPAARVYVIPDAGAVVPVLPD